jgi:serine/threonine protein kinase
VLKHPHILTHHHSYEDKHAVMQVLELCDCTLRQVLERRGAFPEQEALYYTKCVLEALKYLHLYSQPRTAHNHVVL